MTQIRTVKAAEKWKDSKIVTKEVDPQKVAKKLDLTIRKCGFSPLPNDRLLEIVQQIVDNHNKMTDEIALFMEIDPNPAPTR